MDKYSMVSKGHSEHSPGDAVKSSVNSSGPELLTGGAGTEGASKQAVGARIVQVRGYQKQDDFAQEIGVATGTLGRYERGERMADTECLQAIVTIKKISPAWLMFGIGPREFAEAAHQALIGHSNGLATKLIARDFGAGLPYGAQFNPAELVMLPYYDIRAAAGHGALVEDGPPTDVWFFKRSWIDQEVRVPPKRLALCSVAGDSMVPDIYDGDVIMIDRGDIELPREGVYVYSIEDRVYVKKLALDGTKLMVVSRNTSMFSPQRLDLLREDASFKLIGRALGRPTFIRF